MITDTPVFLIPPRLHVIDPWRFKTRPNAVIRVFRSSSRLMGHLLLDTNFILSADPWTAAMKWVDHMGMRGYDSIRVDDIQFSHTIVIVVAEKSYAKS